jgi:hypothetical protein
MVKKRLTKTSVSPTDSKGCIPYIFTNAKKDLKKKLTAALLGSGGSVDQKSTSACIA